MREEMLYSFDVFDTVITRTTATPFGVFVLIQKELNSAAEFEDISIDLRENFALIRSHAEELARNRIQRDGIEDVTLDEIYEYIAMRGELKREELERIKILEIKMELECSVPIISNIAYIKELLKEGKKVAFISDMYLSKDNIRKMLIKADPVLSDVPLYVSSEFKKIKFTGNLYRKVHEIEKVDYSDWVHYGDKMRADKLGAEKVGITSTLFEFPELTELEKKFLESNILDSDIQLMVGTSRNLRLNNTVSNEYIIGTSIGSILLIPYVEWIIKRSIENDIERLYFIARDGFILKIIADIIISSRGLNIKTHYIYGSRKAWRMISFSEKNNDLIELLAWSHINRITTIKKMAEVLQIEENELRDYLKDPFKTVEYMSPIIRGQIIEQLNRDEFITFLINKHKDRRKLAIRYLQENIDTSDDKFAFVELGGSGYTQECLQNIMIDFYKRPIRTFFYKMDMLRVSQECIFYTFYPSKLQQHILIEALCHAPHGQTKGYKDVDQVVPDLETYEDDELIKHGINDYIEGIKDFIQIKCQLEKSHINEFNITLQSLNWIYEYLCKTEDEVILNFIGDMPNSVTGREQSVVGYAPKLTNKDILKIFLGNRRNIDEYYCGTSLECSLKRCDKKQNKKIEWYKKNYGTSIGKTYRYFVERKIVKDPFVVPKNLLNKQLVLYGAGNRGKQIYRKFNKRNIVLWVDKNWKDKTSEGLNIKPIESISDAVYDFIIITVENERIVREIKNNLLKMGIAEEKILNL